MRANKQRLYVLCDIEGASGISIASKKAMLHGSPDWTEQGRSAITSDVKAVCEAAVEYGIEEIILNDAHDSMHRTPNVIPDQLPREVRLVRRPYLPGKPRRIVGPDPFGMVIVGQHAMAGGGGVAPHTIAWPFAEMTINGLKVGEIGIELAVFMGTPLLALVGEQEAVDEAQALCPNCVGISVKSMADDWFPSPEEVYPAIHQQTLAALRRHDEMTGLNLKPPFRFTLRPHESLWLDREKRFFLRTLIRHLFFHRCKATMTEREVSWETQTIIGGLYLLQTSRAFMRKREPARPNSARGE